jgi:riboflavin kinase/FMN adenylyltransferase
MEQLAHPAEAPRGGKVIALGSFDGVHLGHQALLRAALARARQLDLPLLVYTFDPPGRTFFSGEPLLSEREEKLELLEELGVDLALVARFDAEFAQRSAQEFLEDLRALEARWIYVGEDFRFGHRRQGGVEDLAQVAPVEPLPLLEWEGQPVKSSRIRALLQEARLDEVQALLGRPYTARGRVIPGDQRGRTLG